MAAVLAPEVRNLVQLESVIAQGLATFIDVGNALLEIRSRRLYHGAGFKTFEDYCRDRWQFSRQRAAQMIDAAFVAGALSDGADLSTTVDIPNERGARELSQLAHDNPEAAREVWGEVTADPDERPTAQRIRQTVATRYPAYAAPAPRPSGSPKVAVVNFAQILEWQPREMASALPADQIEGQIAEATAAQRWLSTYIKELSARRCENEDAVS